MGRTYFLSIRCDAGNDRCLVQRRFWSEYHADESLLFLYDLWLSLQKSHWRLGVRDVRFAWLLILPALVIAAYGQQASVEIGTLTRNF